MVSALRFLPAAPRASSNSRWRSRRPQYVFVCCASLAAKGSRLLEVSALVDRPALKVTAQAVEPQLHRAQAQPLAAAENTAASRRHPASRGNGEADGTAE